MRLLTSVDKVDVEIKIGESLKQLRAITLSARTSLTAVNDRLSNIGTQHAGKIDVDDRPIVAGYSAKIQKAITELNTLLVQIDTDFPSIQND